MKGKSVAVALVSLLVVSVLGGGCASQPPEGMVRKYIQERLKNAFDDPTNSDLAPRNGQTRYAKDADTLGSLVKENIGSILLDDGKAYEIEPMCNEQRATRWIADEIPPEDQKVASWFVDRNAGLAVDVLSSGGGNVGMKEAVQLDYLRTGQFKIDPAFDYMAAAALWAIRNDAFAGLPGYRVVSTENRWVIIGAVVNRLAATEFTEWDFKGNVSGQLIGVGGSIFFKNSTSGSVYKYKCYYIVTTLDAAIRAGYQTALDKVDPKVLAAAMKPKNNAEAQRISAFFNLVNAEDASAVLSRLANDPDLLAQMKTIPWETAPSGYGMGAAFAMLPADSIKKLSPDATMPVWQLNQNSAFDLKKMQLWKDSSGADLMKSLNRK